ncbi:MAG: MBL fold metallo-hydrolase [Caldilineaceae bacterium]|nr:MBL fold metallo-hydrolase [Caldilineaceae bacterium]
MKITQHGQYLIQLTRLGAINCYLVREEDGFTLIDTNMPGSAAGILAAARKLDAPIRRIALTHAHNDHAATLDQLAAQLPQAEVALGTRTAAFLHGDMTMLPDEPTDKLRGGYITCATEPTRLLAPGDHIGSLEVIATPGHTPDHLSFLDARDGSLIAGDAFQTKAGIAVAGTVRWLFPLPAWATWHKATALRSAQRLLDRQPTRLAVGHGAVLEQPQAAMLQAIEAAAIVRSR